MATAKGMGGNKNAKAKMPPANNPHTTKVGMEKTKPIDTKMKNMSGKGGPGTKGSW